MNFLDTTDCQILDLLDRNCRTHTTEIAKKVGKSRQSIEYRIGRLVSRGIITSFNTAFNPHKIGVKVHKLYLKLRNISLEKSQLLDTIRNSKKVWWMGECSGSWDLVVAFFCRSDYEFFYLKNEILGTFNKIVVESKTETLLDAQQFNKMYFTREAGKSALIGGEIVINELDELEFSLLAEITNNARIPITQLAEKLYATPQAVQSLLKKLEERGVIIHYRIGIDITKLGLQYYKAIIKFDHYTEKDQALILSYVSKIPNMQYFIRNLSDVELEMVVSSFQEYHDIIEKFKKEFPLLVRSVDSVLMMSDLWTPGFGGMNFGTPTKK